MIAKGCDKRTLRVLKKVEWAVSVRGRSTPEFPGSGSVYGSCPYCGRVNPDLYEPLTVFKREYIGHAEDCLLASQIKILEKRVVKIERHKKS